MDFTTPKIMGILNVTPDSFSDGGKYNSTEAAVKRAKEIEAEGADFIDIGGESSGPGSTDVSEKDELKRVIPVIEAVNKEVSIPISIDTYKSKVAEKAIKAGATIINDVTAGRVDPKIFDIAAAHGSHLILMYSKDPSARTTREALHYDDVVQTISMLLFERAQAAEKVNVSKEKIIIDTGMGAFISGDPKYSFEVIARLQEFKKLGYPILIGPSRKSFLGGKLEDRLNRTMASIAICFFNGADMVRVHDVKEAVEVREIVLNIREDNF